MANLYVTEQNSVLRKTGDRILVKKDDKILLEVQCHKIDAVLIFGNVQFTTQVVHELLEHDIEMAILTKTGRLIGQITSPSPKNIELRLKQFRKYDDVQFKLEISKQFVSGKIQNCINMIQRFSSNHSDELFKVTINTLQSKLDKIKCVENVDSLLGLEGSSAKEYFNVFRSMLLCDFGFNGRKKHPSTDPVNALLSLSYTMLFNEIASLLDGLGFDPYLAYYHSVDYGRESLASDLIEEFRAPVADHLVLNLLNNKVFKENDFYTKPKGEAVFLLHDSLKRYFVEYEKAINHEFVHPITKQNTTFRRCFRIQIESLASCLQNGSEYVHFVMER